MDDSFAAADRFLLRSARLLERRLFEACFLGAPASGVTDALRGYQNFDGGFGQCLEPDTRCPASLPIYVEVAFQALAAASGADRGEAARDAAQAGRDSVAGDTGRADRGSRAADPGHDGGHSAMLRRACGFLAATADAAGAGGGVPLAMPVIELYPRAAHMTEWTYQPGLNPTAGLAGLLYQLGFDHPWRQEAARFCWERLSADGLPDDAHALSETLIFLENVPDTDRADSAAAGLAEHLASVSMLNLDPGATDYGLTPLHLAPHPESRWRSLFTDEQIEAHLDTLAAKQQGDGGWPISWEPPAGAAAAEWRGIVTLQALRTLTAYGRIAAPSQARG